MIAAHANDVLAAVGIHKRYPGVHALDDVTLRLQRGRLVGLLGENGAGKSTLLNVFAGAVRPDQGTLSVEGRGVSFRSPREAAAHGVAAIFQELSLLPNLTVAENIFLGREPRTRWGTTDYRALNQRALKVLRTLNLHADPEARVSTLRVGQQQVVEIARALSRDARVLIMDEPTSALSVQEVRTLRALTKELKGRGVAVLYITHKLDELDGLADEYAVMRDGRIVAQGVWGDRSEADIVRLMIGRESAFTIAARPARQDEEALRVERAFLPHPTRRDQFLVHDVDLVVRKGEILGLFGLMGAGRTELLETIFGVHADRARLQLHVNGSMVALRGPFDAIAAGIAMAPEDRKHDGLILHMSARGNASLACLKAASRWGFLGPRREAAHVLPYLTRFRLRGGSVDSAVRNFSGGNQQKVILAKWLATQPAVLLLDEPTRGIDVNAKKEIHQLIHELAAGGLAVIVASSELPEVLALSHRILVLCEGRKTAEFDALDATAESLMHAALPRRASGEQS